VPAANGERLEITLKEYMLAANQRSGRELA
jgi:hypothetical protein